MHGMGSTLMAVPRSPKLLCRLRRKNSSCRADSTTSLKSSFTWQQAAINQSTAHSSLLLGVFKKLLDLVLVSPDYPSPGAP